MGSEAVEKWSNSMDCKSTALELRGFKSPQPHYKFKLISMPIESLNNQYEQTTIKNFLSKDFFSQREYFQSSHLGVYKERKTKYYRQPSIEESILDFKSNDHQSTTNAPVVWSYDRMSITTPRKNNKKEDKLFCHKNSRYERLKEQRAKIILSRENAICKIKNGLFTVQSQTGAGAYRVEWSGDKWVCNCPDFIKNGSRPCKHIIALNLYLEIGYVTIEGEQPKIAPVTYSQDWANYNRAQSQEIELFDQFLCQLVSTVEEPEQKGRGRRRLKLSDQIFCCVMKIYSQLSSRRAQCLYYQALQQQQIIHAPHYNAISKTLLKPEITPILRKLVRLSALPLAGVETDLATDSSGFRCSTFGRYCEQTHGTRRRHNWLKVHICIGVNTNIVIDAVITDEYGGDSPQFEKLMRGAAEGFNIGEVSADGNYSSRKNHDIVGELGGRAYIPFDRDATGKARGSVLWKKAFHYFQLHRDEFDEHYHKRSNVESTFSAIKKKFGESVKSKNRVAQENEMLCKIIAYNITVLISAMFELGITPDFLSFTDIRKEQTTSQKDCLQIEKGY